MTKLVTTVLQLCQNFSCEDKKYNCQPVKQKNTAGIAQCKQKVLLTLWSLNEVEDQAIRNLLDLDSVSS